MITRTASRVRCPYPFTGLCDALLPLRQQSVVSCPLSRTAKRLLQLTTDNGPLTKPAASVSGLSPVHYRRRTPRPVSYYALLKWWLLLSQHPGCPRNPTSFGTEPDLGTLAGGLGCFPLDDEAYPPPSSCRCCSRVFGVWFGRVAG